MTSISSTEKASTGFTDNRTLDSNEVASRRFFLFIIYGFFPLLVSLVAGLTNVQATWFASNKNIFNLIFAKYAWGWTSLVFLSHLILKFQRGKLRSSSIARWALATVYWALLTQNVFGSSFRDRVFIATGGSCSSGDFTTYSDCRASHNGTWLGGHRISGHYLLLIHASLFLWEEFGRAIYKTTETPRISREREESSELTYERYIIYFSRAILAIFLWQLVLTSSYFHTFTEKITGMFFGFLYWFVSCSYIYPALGL